MNNKGLPVDKKERTISSKFAVKIKQAREKKGYSLKELAEKIDSSASYINRLERYERKNPTFSLFILLSEALEIDLWELLHIAVEEKEAETKSVDAILLQNNFSIRGIDNVSIDAKTCFVDIIDMIANKLDKRCDFKEFLQLGEMIRRLHEILDNDEEVRKGA
ncbi:helix-turn-helix transcriptional regulator [Virgibacillus sp. MSP4-1]|uniref:helix-turn-helix domain-containing protein n=1 Tax=Virgibacillus sp. MSP4-1 TaxID=2700081 RepID=UPI0005C4B271|nr:helix-turn-helix transcriptional regulator [Virgibacillus sp. MSP4-1]QHS24327.1 helix-turn-helix transcriptional regulator [Virgibacillus sp. MSP4-1]